jgi:hypothetical protein
MADPTNTEATRSPEGLAEEPSVTQWATRIVAENIDAWGWGPLHESEGLSEHTLAIQAVRAGLLAALRTPPTDFCAENAQNSTIAELRAVLKRIEQFALSDDEMSPEWHNGFAAAISQVRATLARTTLDTANNLSTDGGA